MSHSVGMEVLFSLVKRLECIGFFVLDRVTHDLAIVGSSESFSITESELNITLFLRPHYTLRKAREEIVKIKKLDITWKGNEVGVHFKPPSDILGPKLIMPSHYGDSTMSHPEMVGIDESKTISVPLSFNVSCSILRFESSEIHVVNNSVIIHDYVILKDDEYFVAADGDYFICLDAAIGEDEEDIKFDKLKHVSSDFTTGKIMTGICLSCSLLFLLLTLLVYTFLKALHTVPGLNLILLTSSLFVAQVVYLFGAGTVATPTICTVIGVVIHYFWLVSFAWMNICCVHMYRVFTNLFSALDFADDKICVMLKYSAFAYGIPGLIVGTTLLTTFIMSDYKSIAYGGEYLCFVAHGLVSILSFGIPAGLTVLTNSALLLITTVYVRRTANVNYVGKTEASDISKFFKLSTITGVSWLFGFLGYFLQRVELMYVFTVLTAGQGVFIFLAFVASRRILKMLRQTFQSRKGQGSSRSYVDDRTSSTSSKPVSTLIVAN